MSILQVLAYKRFRSPYEKRSIVRISTEWQSRHFISEVINRIGFYPLGELPQIFCANKFIIGVQLQLNVVIQRVSGHLNRPLDHLKTLRRPGTHAKKRVCKAAGQFPLFAAHRWNVSDSCESLQI